MHDYVLSKLISGLPGLSNRELRHLATLLRDPNISSSVARVVDEIIRLRDMEKHLSQGDLSDVPASHHGSGSRDALKLLAESPAETTHEVFERILLDKTAFPSTHDVVEVLNRAFGVSFAYKDFKRSGRRPLINKAWKTLLDRPRRARISALRRLLNAARPSEASEYRELFTTLTRDG